MGKVILHLDHMENNHVAVVLCKQCGIRFASAHLDYLLLTVNDIHARFCPKRISALEWYKQE